MGFKDAIFKDVPPINVCGSCKLNHKKVDFGGISYCPNPLCFGCGNGNFRSKLDSYEEDDREPNMHTVNDVEWLFKGLQAAYETKDEAIIAVALKNGEKIVERYVDYEAPKIEVKAKQGAFITALKRLIEKYEG